MRAVVFSLIALAFAGLVGRGLVACATNDDSAAPPDEPGVTSDGQALPDGPTTDAGLDANEPDGAEPCSPDGWCYSTLPSAEIADAASIDPNYVPVDFEDIWPMPDHDAWAVADQGYVLRWTNHAWHLAFSANSPLHTVWAASKDDVWVGGGGGLVFHGTTTAGVLAFVKIELGTTEDVLRIRGKSSTDVLAVTATNVYRSTGAAFALVPFPNGIPRDGSQTIADMWGSGDALWVGARELSTCFDGDVGCNFVDRSVLLRWKGLVADAGANASWERIVLQLQCGRTTCAIKSGTTTPTGTHFLHVAPSSFIVGSRSPPAVAHVTLRDAGILDASASQGDGGYIWELDDPQLQDEPSAGIWAAADSNAWSIGDPGVVRHWDSQASWNLSRASLTSPLVKPLHATSGVSCTDGTRDIWIVGGNVALHRSEPQ